MEDGLDALRPTVEGTIDESDSEELPVSYGCVAEPVPEVLAREPVRVGDDTDEPTARLEAVDNSLNAFFKELWAGRDIMKRKVVTDDVKRPSRYGAYIAHLKNRGQTHRLGPFPSFRNRRDIWVETDQLAGGPLLEVATTATPTVKDEISRLDALPNKLPLE
jgi:hypothetical protein